MRLFKWIVELTVTLKMLQVEVTASVDGTAASAPPLPHT